ncbi:MAG: hypothetical protein ACFFDI_22970 [Promethearchaeota archaeon]
MNDTHPNVRGCSEFFSTQEIFDFVRKWTMTDHPGTAHAMDRGDIYD